MADYCSAAMATLYFHITIIYSILFCCLLTLNRFVATAAAAARTGLQALQE